MIMIGCRSAAVPRSAILRAFLSCISGLLVFLFVSVSVSSLNHFIQHRTLYFNFFSSLFLTIFYHSLSLSLHLFSHFSYKLYFLFRFFSIVVIVISPANKNFRFLDRLSPHATSFHLRPRRSTVKSIVEACF